MVGEDFLGVGGPCRGLTAYLFHGPVPKRVILVSATKGVAPSSNLDTRRVW